MSGGITLGYFLIAVAAVDAVAVPLMARGMKRDTEEQRRAARIVLIAGLAMAACLVLIGLFLPAAQLRLI